MATSAKGSPYGDDVIVGAGAAAEPSAVTQDEGRMQQQMRWAIDQVVTPQLEALDAKLVAGQAELAAGLKDVKEELHDFQSQVVVRLDRMLEAMMRDRL